MNISEIKVAIWSRDSEQHYFLTLVRLLPLFVQVSWFVYIRITAVLLLSQQQQHINRWHVFTERFMADPDDVFLLVDRGCPPRIMILQLAEQPWPALERLTYRHGALLVLVQPIGLADIPKTSQPHMSRNLTEAAVQYCTYSFSFFNSTIVSGPWFNVFQFVSTRGVEKSGVCCLVADIKFN